MDPRQDKLRKLPKIDELVRARELAGLGPRWALVEALRREVAALRDAITTGASDQVEVDFAAVRALCESLSRPSLRRLWNATGVVLHTNLGRAPLHPDAIAHAADIAAGYGNLEYDVAAGGRGSRHGHLRALVRDLTGAEDAVVVNNNAAAVMLCLAAHAAGREAVVSRGELIEIGGSFRVPDVMRMSGATLVEVGTTNKTRAADYQAAIGDATALLLKVHRSNFAIVGFTEEVDAAELAAIGRARGVATMNDLGSGALLEAADLVAMGLPAEPGVRSQVAAGLDLVTFSGDKLLGGPQAGLIVGRAAAVDAARRHPLMRALRPDKLTLAALEATLALYRDGRGHDVPALAMLAARSDDLARRANALAAAIGTAPAGLDLAVEACESAVGGGALPTATLPSWAVAVAAPGGRPGPDAIDRALRAGERAVVARISDGKLLLDVRTIADHEVTGLAAAVREALARGGESAWR